ncbi:MAG TPA: hypothetical protein PKW35_14095, partial [Nannocystaceae bacterium]|nr:hypothetical protein [Nannocystaceae bacterium]
QAQEEVIARAPAPRAPEGVGDSPAPSLLGSFGSASRRDVDAQELACSPTAATLSASTREGLACSLVDRGDALGIDTGRHDAAASPRRPGHSEASSLDR